MSGCGCDPVAPCSCNDPVGALHGAALTVGGSIGSLLAVVTAALSVGPSSATHARNAVHASLGLPFVGRDGKLYASTDDPAGVPVGYGLALPDPTAPRAGRSASWRQCPLPVRAPVADSERGG